MRTTYMARPGETPRKWYVVDAEGQALGRLASKVASILRGKHKPDFTPHVDTGDNVIVVNASKVVLTGRKLDRKIYYRHTHYPGGLRSVVAGEMLRTRPEQMVEMAVRGMLPRNRLGRQMIKKLKVYRGPEHPHEAQQPEKLEV